MPSVNNENVSKKQNLLPKKTYYMYLGKKAALPAVIVAVVVCIILTLVGKQFPDWIKNVKTKTLQLNQKSRAEDIQKENEHLDQLIFEDESIKSIYDARLGEYDIDNLSVDTSDDEELARLRDESDRLAEALNFNWDSINVNDKVYYEAQLLMSAIFQDIFKKESIGDDDLTGIAITALEDERTNTTTGDWIHYASDVSDTVFVMRGICDNPTMLQDFLIELNKCQYIKDAKTKSIEAKTITTRKEIGADGQIDYVTQNLFVFEVSIIPKLKTLETSTEAATEVEPEPIETEVATEPILTE